MGRFLDDRRRGLRQAGFGLTELIVVLALLGLLVLMSAPLFLSYLQTARLKAGAQEVAAFLNQGRQIAIKENQNVCASAASNTLQYRLVSCVGAVWVGPGTDTSGNIRVPAGLTLVASANPVFNYLGAATPAATFTVGDPARGTSLRVTVAASGRVSIGP